jgi:hypothetical protein
MARHSIGADAAFQRLRDHSQHNGRKLSDVAAAVVESHLLLLPPVPPAPDTRRPDPADAGLTT